MNEFQRILGITYYNQNYLNLGVTASNYIGNHGDPLEIVLPNGIMIQSTINRNINNNNSVRFYGGIQWHQFIQDNYNLNAIITFQVINPNTINIIQNAQ